LQFFKADTINSDTARKSMVFADKKPLPSLVITK